MERKDEHVGNLVPSSMDSLDWRFRCQNTLKNPGSKLIEVIYDRGLEWLLIAWGVVTVVFIILLFYRSTLTRQEDDQLFIDESASSMVANQREVIAKVNKVSPLIKVRAQLQD